jgi:hypothetical protein
VWPGLNATWAPSHDVYFKNWKWTQQVVQSRVHKAENRKTENHKAENQKAEDQKAGNHKAAK